MNRIKILRAGIAILSVSILVTSCAPDNDEDVLLPRDKFIGTWNMESNHTDPNQAATQNWELIIEPYNSNSEIVALKNLDQIGFDKTVVALVSGTNLTIPDTTITLNGGGQQTIQGTGSLHGSILHLDYTSFDGIVTDTATATSH